MELLNEGRLLALDEPSRLQSRISGQLIEVIADTPRPPVDVLASIPGIADVQLFGDRAHARVSGISADAAVPAVAAALTRAGVAPLSIRPIAASLEDVFIDLITAR